MTLIFGAKINASDFVTQALWMSCWRLTRSGVSPLFASCASRQPLFFESELVHARLLCAKYPCPLFVLFSQQWRVITTTLRDSRKLYNIGNREVRLAFDFTQMPALPPVR